MRITLVNPPASSEADKHWARYPILGLGYVAGSLRAAGHAVDVVDGKLDDLDIGEICERVSRRDPQLVGITCMTVEFPVVREIARQLRQGRCKAPVVLGGAHVNAVGARALQECPDADFACVGEGEHLSCEVAEALSGERDLGTIRGLAHRKDGRVVANPAREYHDDYDGLAFPAWDLFNIEDQIPIMTHRGCPFQCNFCGHNSGFKARYRSANNVLDEIGYAIDRFSPAHIRFEDETFGLNVLRTKEILHGILERSYQKMTSFSAQTRVDKVDRDSVRLLKACNFTWLELGVESGNPEVLARMGKGITLPDVERAVALAKEEGLKVWCKFILGHPHETREAIRDTVRFIAKINPDQLSVSLMTPYPGTPIFDMAIRGEGGYRLLSGDWARFDKYTSGVLELEEVSLARLKAYQALCYLNLYIRNRRYGSLIRLGISNSKLVAEMGVQLVSSLVRPPRGREESDDLASVVAEPVPLSNVAMPDSTLIRLRQGASRRRGDADGDGVPLRSWAAPGAP